MNSPIGQNIPRADGKDKVTGAAVYTGDMKPPGMLYGKVLRSPLPHARIRRIDSRRAEAISGVMAVLTRENLRVASPLHGAYVKDQPVVALEKARYSAASPWRSAPFAGGAGWRRGKLTPRGSAW